MQMRTKTKYKKDKSRVEKNIQEQIELNPIAKKQSEFYNNVFKANKDTEESKSPERKLSKPRKEIEPTTLQSKEIAKKSSKKYKPNPFKREKEIAEMIRKEKMEALQKKIQEKEEREKEREENKKKRRTVAKKLQERGPTGQLRMANQIEHLFNKITNMN